MRGSETVKEDFKTQIFDIFGTVDLEQLRAIAQKVQLIESEKPHNERGAGRKNSLTPQQLAEMLALHQQGMGATELAKKYGISRQTIYKQLERAQNFSNDPNTMLRLNYMNRNDLCTTIDVDFKHEKIKIKNYTDKIPLNAAALHRPVATDALGDCLRNDRLFQLFVFFNGRTGLFQYSVNLGALCIQKRRNALLLRY